MEIASANLYMLNNMLSGMKLLKRALLILPVKLKSFNLPKGIEISSLSQTKTVLLHLLPGVKHKSLLRYLSIAIPNLECLSLLGYTGDRSRSGIDSLQLSPFRLKKLVVGVSHLEKRVQTFATNDLSRA